jgi:hypothetical protein
MISSMRLWDAPGIVVMDQPKSMYLSAPSHLRSRE